MLAQFWSVFKVAFAVLNTADFGGLCQFLQPPVSAFVVGRDFDPVWPFFDSIDPWENPKTGRRHCGKTLVAAAIAVVAAAAPFILGPRSLRRLPPLHARLLPVFF